MCTLMGSPDMISQSPWVLERFGARGARAALMISGVVFMTLIGTWAWVQVMSAWHAGHALRAVFEVLVALLLVTLSLRIMAVNWRATRPADGQAMVLPDGGDQTGVWGVGGPSMRVPGSTGAWPMRSSDRHFDQRQD